MECTKQYNQKKPPTSNQFNKYFINVGPNISKQFESLQPGNIFDYLKTSNQNSMFLKPTSENEIYEVVHKFKNKFSDDFNNINMNVVKKVIHCILKPLTYICNLSFQTGTFPDEMKIARVFPIYKSGKKEHFENYRPISLLPQFSKILEKLYDNRLDIFLEKNDILSDCQYGFRKNHSTCLALIELLDKLTKSLDNKKHTVGIYTSIYQLFAKRLIRSITHCSYKN